MKYLIFLALSALGQPSLAVDCGLFLRGAKQRSYSELQERYFQKVVRSLRDFGLGNEFEIRPFGYNDRSPDGFVGCLDEREVNVSVVKKNWDKTKALMELKVRIYDESEFEHSTNKSKFKLKTWLTIEKSIPFDPPRISVTPRLREVIHEEYGRFLYPIQTVKWEWLRKLNPGESEGLLTQLGFGLAFSRAQLQVPFVILDMGASDRDLGEDLRVSWQPTISPITPLDEVKIPWWNRWRNRDTFTALSEWELKAKATLFRELTNP